MTKVEQPIWFKKAISNEPKKLSIKVKGVKIAYNAWGEKDNPGILFVHGGMAHADWWNFIAPYFIKTHRVIAMNLGGMGDSDWRKEYSTETWGIEIESVCKKEKLKNEPILIQKNLERKIEYVEMPNLIGKTVRDAFSELKRAGIKPQISGRGLIVSQSIEAGTKIEKKSICILKAAVSYTHLTLPTNREV